MRTVTTDIFVEMANDLLGRAIKASGVDAFISGDPPEFVYEETHIGSQYTRGVRIALRMPGHWHQSFDISIDSNSVREQNSIGRAQTSWSSGSDAPRALPVMQAMADFTAMWNGGVEELLQKHEVVAPHAIDGEVYVGRLEDGTLFSDERYGIPFAFSTPHVFNRMARQRPITAEVVPGYIIADRVGRPVRERFGRFNRGPGYYASLEDAKMALDIMGDEAPDGAQVISLAEEVEVST